MDAQNCIEIKLTGSKQNINRILEDEFDNE